MIDFSCFTGTWPFHKIRRGSFSDILSMHKSNGIEKGFISSLDSIFCRDFMESEQTLYEIVRNSDYAHIMTVNPLLPNCIGKAKYALENWNIKGIRIHPYIHKYSMQDPMISELTAWMKSVKLPLYLTYRIQDQRVDYIIKQEPAPLNELELFLKTEKDLTVLICNIYPSELKAVEEAILLNENVFFDICGFKNGLFPLEGMERKLLLRMVYGSLAPLLCMTSTRNIFDMADIDENIKKDIALGHTLRYC